MPDRHQEVVAGRLVLDVKLPVAEQELKPVLREGARVVHLEAVIVGEDPPADLLQERGEVAPGSVRLVQEHRGERSDLQPAGDDADLLDAGDALVLLRPALVVEALAVGERLVERL
jgi:hypothetical protein